MFELSKGSKSSDMFVSVYYHCIMKGRI